MAFSFEMMCFGSGPEHMTEITIDQKGIAFNPIGAAYTRKKGDVPSADDFLRKLNKDRLTKSMSPGVEIDVCSELAMEYERDGLAALLTNKVILKAFKDYSDEVDNHLVPPWDSEEAYGPEWYDDLAAALYTLGLYYTIDDRIPWSEVIEAADFMCRELRDHLSIVRGDFVSEAEEHRQRGESYLGENDANRVTGDVHNSLDFWRITDINYDGEPLFSAETKIYVQAARGDQKYKTVEYEGREITVAPAWQTDDKKDVVMIADIGMEATSYPPIYLQNRPEREELMARGIYPVLSHSQEQRRGSFFEAIYQMIPPFAGFHDDAPERIIGFDLGAPIAHPRNHYEYDKDPLVGTPGGPFAVVVESATKKNSYQEDWDFHTLHNERYDTVQDARVAAEFINRWYGWRPSIGISDIYILRSTDEEEDEPDVDRDEDNEVFPTEGWEIIEEVELYTDML